jgi:protein-tyrosine-phosphatase
MKGYQRKVVFVCTFNGCRSVVAEHFFKKWLLENDQRFLKEIDVTSGGIVSKKLSTLLKEKGIPEPEFGTTCRPQIIEIALKYGIDVSNHKSKIFSRELADKADLILTMEEFQKEEILSRFPQTNGKVFTFREFFGLSGQTIIEDSFTLPKYNPDTREYAYPYEYDGQTIEAIEKCLRQGMEKILEFLNLYNKPKTKGRLK